MKKIMFTLAAMVLMCFSVVAQKNEKMNMKSSEVLVAYFSATGTTARVAQDIADVTGGDLYEIVPLSAYTSADLNWNDKQSRSSVEMNDMKARPDMKDKEKDLSAYRVVFIGYHIWWNEARRIINTFIESADLKGKTLIPFATSGGSGIENSVKMLKKTYPELDWKAGKLLNRSGKDAIREWVESLE